MRVSIVLTCRVARGKGYVFFFFLILQSGAGMGGGGGKIFIVGTFREYNF